MVTVEMDLYGKIETLQAEVAYWKSEALGNAEIDDQTLFARAFGLARQPVWLLNHLYAKRGRTVTRNHIAENMPGHVDPDVRDTKIVDQIIHRIRKKLGHEAVQTVWGKGFYLTPEGITMCDNVKGKQ
jgi:DNA-binding response OmpR family regulator